jgi:hypothetical protein
LFINRQEYNLKETEKHDGHIFIRALNAMEDIILKSIIFCFTLFIVLVWSSSYAEMSGNSSALDKVYADKSHCLVAPEIRGKQDNPFSCYCRDAIVVARYVYGTYLLTGKDQNLNGAYLRLWYHAQQMCGEQYDVLKVTQTKGWQWNGPQVTREYPPEKKINQIQPDSKGFRTVEYKVRLAYRDPGGHVTKVENFTALEKLPPTIKK